MGNHPQAERLVLDWLTSGLAEPVFTETGETLKPGTVKVQVTGGPGAELLRSPSVEVCTYEVGRGAALDLLEKVDQRMMELAANGFPDRFVDDVRLVFYPAVEPYMNTGLHQATASYTIDIRPQ